MKKIIALLIITFGLFITSCEDPIPDCERYSYGDITIVNSTGFWFYFALDDYNDFRLNNGASKTYYNESSGSHKFYIYDDFAEQWYYDTEYLSACEDLTFTWYLNKKKSSESRFYVEVSQNGKVIRTISEFKITEK